MTDKMREDFEAWCVPLGFDCLILADCHCCTYLDNDTENAYMGYQAATEQSTATIAELQKQHEDDCELVRIAALECAQLQGRIDELVEVLKTVNTAVKHGVGASIKDSLLERRIVEALAKVKDVK